MPQAHKVSWRAFMSISGLVVAGLTLAPCALDITPPTAPAKEPAVSGADEALQRLKEGNRRYVAGKSVHPNQTDKRRAEVARGQRPFATILGCVDSRVPPEIVFDRGLGDLFVVRSAGHVLDQAVIGTVEFGVVEYGVPLLVVLGHERCGAVNGTIAALEGNEEPEGFIRIIVEHIAPAVERVKNQPGDLVDNAVRANVEIVVNRLKESPVLAKALHAGKMKIVKGYYHLDTGAVEFTAC